MRLKRWVALLISVLFALFIFENLKGNANTIQLNGMLSLVLGMCTYYIIRKA